MALLPVYIWPDPVLKTVAKPVESVDDELRRFIDDMFETMYDENGIGLAANQVGVLKRVLVIDLDPHGESADDEELRQELASWGFTEPTAFINPEIIASSGSVMWEEGCLSVPGITESVKRKENIVVRALGRDGEPFEIEATGLMAVALQHEMDHLDGRVFVEYLSKLKRDVIRRKMDRLKVESVDDGVGASPV